MTNLIVWFHPRKAHSESSKQWLSILEKENVPVLVCLTFGDRLFVELMGKKGNYDVDTIKAGVENEVEVLDKFFVVKYVI